MRLALTLSLLLTVACRKSSDLDGDGVLDAEDCAPGDASLSDTATAPMAYQDADHDGFGDAATGAASCSPALGMVANGDDCDDNNAQINPSADEDCSDTVDRNCDGSVASEDGDGDGVVACDDCNDDDEGVFPGADESCDGVDENCDGLIDNDPTDGESYAMDTDGDGHGSDRFTVVACDQPESWVPIADADDCNDLDAVVFPGAPEECDGLDNDCDGTIDDGVKGKSVFWEDADEDGYGDASSELSACVRPAGYVTNFGDCSDSDKFVNPAANETCTDTVDKNCDGAVGKDDNDADGTIACDDCDDTRADVEPGAPELCDGVDNNCDGLIDESAPTWYADLDGDGHGGMRLTQVACVAPAGFVASLDDCDDFDGASYPGASEVCDGVANGCGVSVPSNEADADGDGFSACGGDCDDTLASRSPLGVELCNGADDDCDANVDEVGAADAQTWFVDVDNDGFGATSTTKSACSAPSGYAGNDRDCNDGSNQAYPGKAEACDSLDNDCDGEVDEAGATGSTTFYADADGDTYGGVITIKACSAPAGFIARGGDCNDGDATRKPGANELCNGLDDDCNGAVPATENDVDNDGYRACAECDDANAQIRPGNVEVCNTKDDNCNGTADENAADATLWYRDVDVDKFGVYTTSTLACSAPAGYTQLGGDCNDASNKTYPAAAQVCDGVDHDCDGHIDFDEDGDGFAAAWCGGTDCNDNDATKNTTCSYATCRDAYAAGARTNGMYAINPDGAGAFSAYCNQTDQGGGWTLVARMTNGCMTDMRTATGTLTSPSQSGCAKLSDAKINSIRLNATSEGTFWGYQDNASYQLPATGRFLKIVTGDFNASDTQPGLTQQCSCVPGGPFSATYDAHSTMAGVYNHGGSTGWRCVTSGQDGCSASTVYASGLFLYQHALHQAGTFPSNSHGVAGGSNGWLYVR